MTGRRVAHDLTAALLVTLAIGAWGAPVMAQEGGTIEVTNLGVIMETARGDSVVLASVEPGTVLGGRTGILDIR